MGDFVQVAGGVKIVSNELVDVCVNVFKDFVEIGVIIAPWFVQEASDMKDVAK